MRGKNRFIRGSDRRMGRQKRGTDLLIGFIGGVLGFSFG
jgi:hypothetical protein